MHALATDAIENAELAGIIASDVSLTHRLLTFVNSAAMGLLAKVSSMEQAVTLLGRAFAVDPHWPHRLVRAEVRLPAGPIRFFALRRRDRHAQPLLREVPYELPKRRLRLRD